MPAPQQISNDATIDLPQDTQAINEMIIHYLEHDHLSMNQVAERIGINVSNVSRRMKRINYVPGYLKNIDNAEVSLLKQCRHKLLNHMAISDLKKVSLPQAATTYGILTDKQLLLEGKPNSIVAYADLVKAQEIVRQERRAFESKYGITQETSVS